MTTTKNKSTTKSVVVTGEVIFENLYLKTKINNSKEIYNCSVRISKTSPSAEKLKKAFLSLIKETKPEKSMKAPNEKGVVKTTKLGVKESMPIFWSTHVKDGDTDEYWSQHDSNHGHLIIQPSSKNKIPIWKKEGGGMRKTDIENYVSFRDKVSVYITWASGHYLGDYVTMYLNGVSVMEKAEDTYSHEDAIAKALASENKLEVTEEKSMEDELDEDNVEEAPKKTTKKSTKKSTKKKAVLKAEPAKEEESFDDVDFELEKVELEEEDEEDDLF